METPLNLFVDDEPGLLSGVPGSLFRSSMEICKLKNCNRESRTAGYCNAHYLRTRKGKDLYQPIKSSVRHGMTKSPEYRTWTRMLQRCYNVKNPRYKDWGGRGITVCDEWRKSFLTFYKDMGDRPEGTSLERNDNNKGYSKNNCRWASSLEQAQNRRSNSRNTSGYTGVRWNDQTNSFIARITYNNKHIWLGCFNTKEEAIQARKNAELEINRTHA